MVVTKTPFSRVMFTLAFCICFIFTILFLLSYYRNQQLENSYSELETIGSKTFGTIREFHLLEKVGNKNYIYTYTVPDENGRLTEMIEYVDYNTHKKLRIGDTVVVVRKSISLLGNKTFISKIIGNTGLISGNKLIEKVGMIGIVFSLGLGLIGVFLMRMEKSHDKINLI